VREFGAGIVGFALMGRVHTYGFRTPPFFFDPAPARIRLVAVCDARKEVEDKAKEEHGFESHVIDIVDWLTGPLAEVEAEIRFRTSSRRRRTNPQGGDLGICRPSPAGQARASAQAMLCLSELTTPADIA
jgi:hypothetical protein